MTLAASGTIGLSDFRSEFYGDSASAGLTDFYRTSGLGDGVQSSNALNASIPTSGTVSLTDFYGASGARLWVGRIVSGAGSYSGISGSTMTFASTNNTTVFDVDIKVPSARSVAVGATLDTLTFVTGSGSIRNTNIAFIPGSNIMTYTFDRPIGGPCTYTWTATVPDDQAVTRKYSGTLVFT